MKYIRTPVGTLVTNDRGVPLVQPEDCPVSRIDFEALNRVCYSASLDFGDEWDLCELGYWDRYGEYHEPCRVRTSYDDDESDVR